MNKHIEAVDFIQIKNVMQALSAEKQEHLLEEIRFASCKYTLVVPDYMLGRKPITYNRSNRKRVPSG